MASKPRKKRKNRKDARGRVEVRVFLRAGARAVKGNIIRSVTVPNRRVSEVARALLGR